MTRRPLIAGVGMTLMLWLGMPGAVGATSANAAIQSLDSVRAAAEQGVRQHYAQPGSRVVAAADPLDLRLQLAACHQPLQAVVPELVQPRPVLTVAVRCPQADGWTVRAPVRLQLFRAVLVTNRALLRGDGIGAGDVHAEERDVTRLGYGYIDNLQQIADRTLARAVARGSVLTPATLGGRRMVHAGDHVQVLARLDGIEVRAEGVALGSGDNGARLRIRNTSSGRVLDAMVSAPGVVVALP